MSFELYLGFALATAILIIIPGPAVTFIVATSLSHGARAALTGVAGSSTALACQLILVAFGMNSILYLLSDWFEWLRWIGVAYLLWIGYKQWTAKAVALDDVYPEPIAHNTLFWRGFVVNGTNPKTYLFFAAFFPQFIDTTKALGPQFAVLCVTFLVIATVFDSSYAVAASRLRPFFANRRRAMIRNRISGALLITAGLGLAVARKSN